MQHKEILEKLKSLRNTEHAKGMALFGIKPKTKVYGISVPELRKIAKIIKKDHRLALKLWDSGIHEARLLAGFIADPAKVTEKQFEKWVSDFDSWDICDQVCGNLFDKTDFVYKKIFELSERKREFVKRTAFSLIACLAVHDKNAEDGDFIKFFPLIKKGSGDDRIYVKKAVNWSLRQIGKRNKKLNKEAIILAKEILQKNSKSAKWVANNAIKELANPKIRTKLK